MMDLTDRVPYVILEEFTSMKYVVAPKMECPLKLRILLHPIKKMTYRCCLCFMSFDTSSMFRRHQCVHSHNKEIALKRLHPIRLYRYQRLKNCFRKCKYCPIKCKYCPSENFTVRSARLHRLHLSLFHQINPDDPQAHLRHISLKNVIKFIRTDRNLKGLIYSLLQMTDRELILRIKLFHQKREISDIFSQLMHMSAPLFFPTYFKGDSALLLLSRAVNSLLNKNPKWIPEYLGSCQDNVSRYVNQVLIPECVVFYLCTKHRSHKMCMESEFLSFRAVSNESDSEIEHSYESVPRSANDTLETETDYEIPDFE